MPDVGRRYAVGRMTDYVIFDCDGVLVDTEPIANRVLAGLLTSAGLPTTVEESMRDYRGRSMAAVIGLAGERLGAPLPTDIADRYYVEIEAAFRDELRPVPGIMEALDRIDLPSCVASSGPHHRIRLSLGLVGLWKHFEGKVFSATEVAVGKPAPDLFLYAAETMGFDPAQTAVVEDSPAGVAAAVAAGMWALAFARYDPPAGLRAIGGEPFEDMTILPDLLTAGSRVP